ncbi:hypothetical protein Tco_0992800 [Tanacetum coccineum]|uniref:Uncharacterized protein n=1 Tax=Tanacetum coccineum TaxID=301880 RepID=A0ABQ5F340_9ASTR
MASLPNWHQLKHVPNTLQDAKSLNARLLETLVRGTNWRCMVKLSSRKTSIRREFLRSNCHTIGYAYYVGGNKNPVRLEDIWEFGCTSFNNLKAYWFQRSMGTLSSSTQSSQLCSLLCPQGITHTVATRAINTAQCVNTASTQDAVDGLTTIKNLSLLL